VQETRIVTKRLHDFPDDSWTIDRALASGAYEQWRAALGMAPADIQAHVKDSGLRGRGGAGFPTATKWSSLPPDLRPRYLVVNGDEGEPSTFKDREIMLRNPHALIEGVLIMSYAIGATSAFIYIRGEYRTEFEVLRNSLEAMRKAVLLGGVTIVLHRGAGAYICGEETALLESLEGKRGQPRSKPPFPAIQGLYASPTLINNVETVTTVPPIIEMGGADYAKLGVPNSRGTRIVSVSGNVVNGGNYEIVPGMTVRAIIDELGGGIADGRELQAVVPGGSSTVILTKDEIDVGYDFDSLAQLKTAMGSTGLIVLDDRCCIVQLGIRFSEFYEHESCGKCTPCREGTRWLTAILRKLEDGRATRQDLDLLLDVCDRINGKCLCPLGDSDAIIVASYVAKFRDEFIAHIEEGGCPFGGESSLDHVLAPIQMHTHSPVAEVPA
jgi:NADH-quinone oxidoreductase subunit F